MRSVFILLTSLSLLGLMAPGQDASPIHLTKPAPAGDAALDAILRLPEQAGPPTAIDAYENPLLSFAQPGHEVLTADDSSVDLLPPLAPFLPNPPAPAPPPATPPTPGDLKLQVVGQRVAASVVGIRVWDALGGELAAGVGSFVTRDGVVLTDTGLLHPEIAAKVDYITLTAADGTNQRATGFYVADLTTGVTLLQAEEHASTPIELFPGADFSGERECYVLAVSEKRGLVLAEARVRSDQALSGLGWLDLRGKDSPGAVGSPVLSDDGRLMAIVGLKVPLKSWMNFALPADQAALAIRRERPALRPLDDLPKMPTFKQVVESPEFVDAFHTLQQRRVEPAMRKLLQLVRKHPRSAECWALLGLSASHMGAAPEALNCQRKAVALDPQAGLYWHQLAIAKLRESPGARQDTTEDMEALELAVQQRPNDGPAWLMLASRHLRGGDLLKAHDALRRALLLAPNEAQAHYLMAYVRGRQGDVDGAHHAIHQSLALNPGSADAWYYQGLLLEKKGVHSEAAKAFRNAVRLQPAHSQAWLNLAHAYRKTRQPNEAREAFLQHQRRSAVSASPQSEPEPAVSAEASSFEKRSP